MNVIKRDGSEVNFDLTKIKSAISKANSRSNEMTVEDIDRIIAIVENKCLRNMSAQRRTVSHHAGPYRRQRNASEEAENRQAFAAAAACSDACRGRRTAVASAVDGTLHLPGRHLYALLRRRLGDA